MTSKIKVNNIEDTSGNALVTKCGSTVTLGKSGDTVAIASGATTSGMGRTGTVDWQTTPKTSTFTAVSGEGYFCNTESGSFEVDLPAGSAGAIVSIQDYKNTFDNNNLTIDPNGSEKINGGDAGIALTLSTEGQGITLIYVDSTIGWRSIHSDDFSEIPQTPAYITATGGTITTVCTNYKVHTFTSPGTFTVCSVGNIAGSNTISYTVIAGGGAGGRGASNSGAGGAGGGAGGYRESRSPQCNSWTVSPLDATTGLPVSATGYPVTIGAGGTAASLNTYGTDTPSASGNGSNTVFTGSTTITSAGGGGGANRSTPTPQGGANGGSGGGSRACIPAEGLGNQPPVSPPQGNNGGAGGGNGTNGGGGGATAVGTSGNGSAQGPGGAGATNSINGTPTARAGGGGAGGESSTTAGANGGAGGGGDGSDDDAGNATAGTANTGGGGGGGAGSSPGSVGKNGGSGIVIIRYRFQ